MIQNAKIIGSNQKRGNAEQPKRGDKSFVMSRTELVVFAECPAKWLAGGEVKEETKQMNFGSLLDCLVTTPEKFAAKFAITPETYPATPARKGEVPEQKPWTSRANYCKEWEAEKEALGLTVVSPEMMQDANKAHAALFEHRPIASLIECSEKQVLIVADWKDDDTGLIVPLAALLDLVPHHSSPTWGKTLADIKTTRCGNPSNWARVCDDSGYDFQASLYYDMYHAARPDEDRVDFVHIVQENVFPFHVVNPPPMLSSEFMEWGRAKYVAALKLYCQCLQTGVWPSYSQTGMAFGNTQIIEPKNLWKYKETAGMVSYNHPEIHRKTVAEVLAEENNDLPML